MTLIPVQFFVYQDKARDWRWYIRAANGKIIAESDSGYKTKQDCLHAVDLTRHANDPVIILDDEPPHA